jgi:hypothetical protein
VGLVGTISALVCVSAVPAAATAVEAKPLAIAGFTMQTTEASPENQLINEPYMFTQAGGHPFALTSTVEFASEEVGADHTVVPTREPKDMIIDLPPGLLANPQAVPRCSLTQSEQCPTDTQVGVFVLHFMFDGSPAAALGPIVNLTPEGGQAAELGLETPLGMFMLAGHIVRTAQGYTVAVIASSLPALDIVSIEITLWGVPAASAHNPQRGLSCLKIEANPQLNCPGGDVASDEEPVAFLTMSSDCSEAPQTASVWADSWEEPGQYVQAQARLPGMAYCDRLPFSPEITVRPETLLSDEAVGVDVSIQVPQAESATVTTPPLRNASVTLPQGMSINPGVADDLQACNPTGPAGINIPTGLNANGEPLGPGEVGPGEELLPNGEPKFAPGHCPKESIVGTAEASTPLLPRPIDGRVYMATPGCGGPGQHACTEQDAVDGNLYRLYVELGASTEENDGIQLKLEAGVQANPTTGQLTVRLTENPQLPLSELNIHLLGGPHALLTNSATCGPATTSSNLEPWSAPYTPNAEPSSSYNVTGCAGAPTLDPGFQAGSANASAGAFSPFTLTVTRGDREQYLSGIQLHTPPGLSAMLSSVPLCEESLANTGKCPEASRIGSSLVATGAGSQPLSMPGNMYLTGAYEGAPFGLSIVTNAVAGPLNLGLISIRARISIDPQTAAMTITSDPLPQTVLGVPLRIQSVTLNINRPHFIFNPTNCETQRVTATITGAQGASADVSNRFALGGCKSLAFKPALEASTSAHTSFADGASFNMKLAFPKAEPGTETNLAQIKIALPKQLPSRLTTLQSACLQATFNTNPATCPNASVVGMASAQTPVLPGQLTGPVYFVSHGHQAFPSPIVVLQGDGVKLNLLGSTVINKAGIVSVAFNTIPDVPIDSLELYLPQGPHSLLSANTSLCALSKTVTIKREITRRTGGHTVRRTVKVRERLPASLPMPTELVAQNGAVIDQNTKINVSGCAASKAKAARRSPAG